jgi:hypothetical protein
MQRIGRYHLSMKLPEKCTVEELQPYHAEYVRRLRLGKTARPKVYKPCPKCDREDLGARELRAHIPVCTGKSPS